MEILFEVLDQIMSKHFVALHLVCALDTPQEPQHAASGWTHNDRVIICSVVRGGKGVEGWWWGVNIALGFICPEEE